MVEINMSYKKKVLNILKVKHDKVVSPDESFAAFIEYNIKNNISAEQAADDYVFETLPSLDRVICNKRENMSFYYL
jgi:hypothetical protein